jgi:hypothetical protein
LIFMLNYAFTMSTAYGLFLFWLLLTMPFITYYQVAERPRIDSPRPGDILQGVIKIKGSSNVTDFQSADIDFKYEGDQPQTWYLIQQTLDKVDGGVLASWDTTTIADGTYSLRLVVNQSDNQSVETVVNNLRVRNYTPVETNTPETSNHEEGSQQTTAITTATMAIQVTSTELPPNPAQVTPVRFSFSIVQGIVYSGVIFVLLGIYLAVHAWQRRK